MACSGKNNFLSKFTSNGVMQLYSITMLIIIEVKSVDGCVKHNFNLLNVKCKNIQQHVSTRLAAMAAEKVAFSQCHAFPVVTSTTCAGCVLFSLYCRSAVTDVRTRFISYGYSAAPNTHDTFLFIKI
jgi:hypothetical protein